MVSITCAHLKVWSYSEVRPPVGVNTDRITYTWIQNRFIDFKGLASFNWRTVTLLIIDLRKLSDAVIHFATQFLYGFWERRLFQISATFFTWIQNLFIDFKGLASFNWRTVTLLIIDLRKLSDAVIHFATQFLDGFWERRLFQISAKWVRTYNSACNSKIKP